MSGDTTASIADLTLPAIASGVLTWFLFHRYEPRNLTLILCITVINVLLVLRDFRGLSSLAIVAVISIFTSALSLSTVAYRLSPFHPLAKFPGPVPYKISKLWSVYINWRGDQHIANKLLHQKYGPFLRTGPNELSIADVRAINAVFGVNGLPKGHYYDARQDPTAPRNLIVLRGEEHANRRRLWNRGMSSESLKEYELLIIKRACQLVSRLEKIGQPVDLSQWLGFFAFDFMGDMAFSGGFELLRDGRDQAGLWTVMENFTIMASITSHIPWAARTLQRVPLISGDLWKMRSFGVACATKRMKSGSSTKDLWYHLTDEPGLEKTKPTVPNVVADGVLAIIAGADTTATALTSLFYYILTHPEAYQHLQEEVDAYFSRDFDTLDSSKFQQMPYLEACISEALRLQPPVPTSGSRRVYAGTGGKIIAGRFVPEGTEVYVPPYSIQRDPRYFEFPDDFRPERWLPTRETSQAFNPEAFFPFSFGPANCAGRNLAKLEMSIVTTLLLRAFSFHFQDSFNHSRWESSLQDYFVLRRAPLLVCLTPRG